MFTGTLPPVSNKADYIETYQFIDDEDESQVKDVSTASDITIEIRDYDSHCVLLSANLSSGVTQIQTGVIQWAFPASSINGLCEGTYELAGRITMDDQTVQFLLMSLPVVTG